MLMLFAVFYCGNIAFVHAHFDEDNDRYELHCHPYLPGTEHSHSQQDLAALSHLQAEMAVIDCPELTVIPAPMHSTAVTYRHYVAATATAMQPDRQGRAPPVV